MKDHKTFTFFASALLLSLAFAANVNAEIFKTVDKDGNVIYTDQRPDADAKAMDLPGLSVISAQEPTRQSPATIARAEAVAVEGQAGKEITKIGDLKRGYQDFAIVHPTQDQIFSGTGNEINGVVWDTRFALQEGMQVIVYVNGVAQEPTSNPVVDIGRLDRGAHTITAELTDRRNRQIAKAPPVTFHVRQHSVNFPRGG